MCRTGLGIPLPPFRSNGISWVQWSVERLPCHFSRLPTSHTRAKSSIGREGNIAWQALKPSRGRFLTISLHLLGTPAHSCMTMIGGYPGPSAHGRPWLHLRRLRPPHHPPLWVTQMTPQRLGQLYSDGGLLTSLDQDILSEGNSKSRKCCHQVISHPLATPPCEPTDPTEAISPDANPAGPPSSLGISHLPLRPS